MTPLPVWTPPFPLLWALSSPPVLSGCVCVSQSLPPSPEALRTPTVSFQPAANSAPCRGLPRRFIPSYPFFTCLLPASWSVTSRAAGCRIGATDVHVPSLFLRARCRVAALLGSARATRRGKRKTMRLTSGWGKRKGNRGGEGVGVMREVGTRGGTIEQRWSQCGPIASDARGARLHLSSLQPTICYGIWGMCCRCLSSIGTCRR